MKLIRMLVVFVVTSLVVGLGVAFDGKTSMQKEHNSNQSSEIMEKEIIDNGEQNKEEKLEELEMNEKKDVKIVQENNPSVSNDNSSSKYNESESKPKVESELKPKTESSNKQQNETKTNVKTSSEAPIESPSVKPVAPTPPTAWEELGISEYDYYNSPMLKWQKVTHNNFETCQTDGEEAIKLKTNPETGEQYQEYTDYWCYGVNSYSGKNIGVMLKLS